MDPRFAARLAPKLKKLLAMKPLALWRVATRYAGKGHLPIFQGKETSLHWPLQCAAKTVLPAFPIEIRCDVCLSAGPQSNRTAYARLQKGVDSREGLLSDPAFAKAIRTAKLQMREMDYRYVEETDQVRQTLLEVYCAVVLQTPFSDFGTH